MADKSSTAKLEREERNLINNKAVKAGIGYTIGNILIKGINIFVLPIFSRIMTTEEFGLYNVFLSFDAILYIFMGFSLHASVKSANYEFKNEIDSYTSSISLIYIFNAALLFILGILFGNYLADIINYPVISIFLLIVFSLGGSLITLFNERMSLEYAYKKFLLISLLNSVINITLSMILIFTFFKTDKALGRMIGTSVTSFFVGCVIIITFYRKAKPTMNINYWRFGIKYSLPIVPHGVSQVLLSQFDRIMIRSYIGDSAAGIYSLASNVMIVLTIITSSISSAWSTWFYEKIDNDHIEIIREKASQLVILFSVFTVGVMSISPELIYILGGKNYLEGKYVAIPMIVSSFVLFIYNVIVPSEYYKRKTIYIMTGTISAAFINVFLNAFFIPKYGYEIAAYTTLFSYICYLIFHSCISYRLINFTIITRKCFVVCSSIILLAALINILFIEHIEVRLSSCIIIAMIFLYYLIKNK